MRIACRRAAAAAACAAFAGTGIPVVLAAEVPATVVVPVIVGDAIPQPLTRAAGDPSRGRAIVADRHVGLCLLCHTGPFPDERSQGTLAPSLAGAGARWSEAQLRLRIVDARRLDPDTIMPAYHRDPDGARLGTAWRGRPILDAQQIEDVVAFLVTLR